MSNPDFSLIFYQTIDSNSAVVEYVVCFIYTWMVLTSVTCAWQDNFITIWKRKIKLCFKFFNQLINLENIYYNLQLSEYQSIMHQQSDHARELLTDCQVPCPNNRDSNIALLTILFTEINIIVIIFCGINS